MCLKKSETSITDRKLIIKWQNEGKSYAEIAQLLGRSKSTVHYMVKKVKTTGVLQNEVRSDRLKKLTKREENVIVREIKKDPIISTPKLATLVADSYGEQVHPELCRKILCENNFHDRISREKPFVSKVNKQKRLNFAERY
ncbi:uncharacterized protein LOC144478048, partial [Augochlora pura]